MSNNPYDIQPELRYGYPVCDEVLIGRDFTIGYSYYFRQAKWTLELVSNNKYVTSDAERKDYFRPDERINARFRASLSVYKDSGYDRGHLVSSANKLDRQIQNSETFLLSNISPQKGTFNRQIWRKLESVIRKIDSMEDILETYVLTAPVFDFDKPIKTIGNDNPNNQRERGINIPVPHAFVKSILCEDKRGNLKVMTFEMENKRLTGELADYLVVTYDAEQRVGGRFWTGVNGKDLYSEKKKADKNIKLLNKAIDMS